MLRPLEHMKTIQSLLLLCMWPFPMDTMITDVSLSMTGVAMQLALQNGLHSFGRRQDFTVQITQNEKQDLFRPRLWSNCKAVCQMYVLHLFIKSHTDGEAKAQVLSMGCSHR
jgi:hypothetical protein